MFAPLLAVAQNEGINFEHGLSWKRIQDKAIKENKYIFIDCFTTWCGPCITMSKDVFPTPEVGKYYNANFINVKVQIDTTAKDDNDVKNWYADAHNLLKEYKIKSFPTFLFFSPNGHLVHRATGGMSKEDFLIVGRNAQSPNKQYYTLVDKFKKGDRDTAMLRYLADLAYFSDNEFAIQVGNEVINTFDDLFSKTNLDYILKHTRSKSHRGFKLMVDNTEKVNELTGPGTSELFITNIIYTEQVKPHLPKSGNPNWKLLEKGLMKEYPAFAKETIARSKFYYYHDIKDWDRYTENYDAFIRKYTRVKDLMLLNNTAWEVFLKTSDKRALKRALAWSKEAIAENDPPNIDTYANLLYKLGNKEEAIKWQQKAIEAGGDYYRKDFTATLEKMKRGEQTWGN